jgi:hypothetical protein
MEHPFFGLPQRHRCWQDNTAQGGVFDNSKSVMYFLSRFLNRQKMHNLHGGRGISTSHSPPGGNYRPLTQWMSLSNKRSSLVFDARSKRSRVLLDPLYDKQRASFRVLKKVLQCALHMCLQSIK